MKKLLSTLTALVLALVLSTTYAAANDMDGVMMKDGKMMMMKDGKASGAMTKDMMMNDGTKVMMDGSMMKKDGSKMMMKDGEMMDMGGKTMGGDKMGGKMMEGK